MIISSIFWKLPGTGSTRGLCSPPRAGKDLALASKVRAFIDSRTYVIPEDVQFVAPAVFGHRVGALQGVRYGYGKVLEIIDKVPV